MVSYNKIAEADFLKGNHGAARITCHKGLAISESRAKRDPNSADTQFDLGVSYEKLGRFSEAAGDKQSACQYFRTALSAFVAAVNFSPDWTNPRHMAQTAAQGVARCCG
jgi:tetratricopeptide (TPR) repeat protein